MPISLFLIGSGSIFIVAVVMLGGSLEISTKAYIALFLLIIYAASIWDNLFSNGRFKLGLEWAKNNKARFISMSTIDSFYFWAVLTLAFSVFISGWFLLVGALANTIFCHAYGVDVLGPPPSPEHKDLE